MSVQAEAASPAARYAAAKQLSGGGSSTASCAASAPAAGVFTTAQEHSAWFLALLRVSCIFQRELGGESGEENAALRRANSGFIAFRHLVLPAEECSALLGHNLRHVDRVGLPMHDQIHTMLRSGRSWGMGQRTG